MSRARESVLIKPGMAHAALQVGDFGQQEHAGIGSEAAAIEGHVNRLAAKRGQALRQALDPLVFATSPHRAEYPLVRPAACLERVHRERFVGTGMHTYRP